MEFEGVEGQIEVGRGVLRGIISYLAKHFKIEEREMSTVRNG
jgi:hypothetical protein